MVAGAGHCSCRTPSNFFVSGTSKRLRGARYGRHYDDIAADTWYATEELLGSRPKPPTVAISAPDVHGSDERHRTSARLK